MLRVAVCDHRMGEVDRKFQLQFHRASNSEWGALTARSTRACLYSHVGVNKRSLVVARGFAAATVL